MFIDVTSNAPIQSSLALLGALTIIIIHLPKNAWLPMLWGKDVLLKAVHRLKTINFKRHFEARREQKAEAQIIVEQTRLKEIIQSPSLPSEIREKVSKVKLTSDIALSSDFKKPSNILGDLKRSMTEIFEQYEQVR